MVMEEVILEGRTRERGELVGLELRRRERTNYAYQSVDLICAKRVFAYRYSAEKVMFLERERGFCCVK